METSGLLPSWEKVPEGRMRGPHLPRERRTTGPPPTSSRSLRLDAFGVPVDGEYWAVDWYAEGIEA